MRVGTLLIQRRYRGVSRINLRSGTRNKTIRNRILATMDSLYERGRLDLLQDVSDGIITPMQLYNAQQQGNIKSLPSAAEIKPLVPHLFDWLDSYEKIVDTTRRGYRDRFTQLVKLGKDSSVADLPGLLERMRAQHKKLERYRSFNQARSAVQAYLRSTLGRQNPVYIAVANIEPLDSTPKRKGNPLSVVEAWAIKDKMPEPMASMFWTLCLTGMGWMEYTGAWEVVGETVEIHGTKRAGRDRIIPKFGELTPPSVPDKVFRKALRKGSKRTVQPYDCRRTFARWLNESEVFDVHQACYMGHGAKSITALYKTPRIVSEILEGDRKKVTAYLKQESLKKVNPKAAEFFVLES